MSKSLFLENMTIKNTRVTVKKKKKDFKPVEVNSIEGTEFCNSPHNMQCIKTKKNNGFPEKIRRKTTCLRGVPYYGIYTYIYIPTFTIVNDFVKLWFYCAIVLTTLINEPKGSMVIEEYEIASAIFFS